MAPPSASNVPVDWDLRPEASDGARRAVELFDTACLVQIRLDPRQHSRNEFDGVDQWVEMASDAWSASDGSREDGDLLPQRTTGVYSVG